MPSKEKAYSQDKTTARQRSNQPEARQFEIVDQPLHPATILQRAKANPRLLTPANMRQLQRTLGNQAVGRLLTKTGSAQSAIQRQLPPEKEEKLMLKPATPGVGPEGGKVPPKVESAINRARGSGQPLESTVQEQMSHYLGHDFSGVRVHTGSEADTLNQQLSAKAFTTGRDIFFRRGTYYPGSSSGRELIAHELSHVVQQSKGRVRVGGGGMTVRPAADNFEREADAMGKQAALINRISYLQRDVADTGCGAPVIQRDLSVVQDPGEDVKPIKDKVNFLFEQYPIPTDEEVPLLTWEGYSSMYRPNATEWKASIASGEMRKKISPSLALIRNLIKHKSLVRILMSTNNEARSTDFGAEVLFDPKENAIVLAHELIHALHAIGDKGRYQELMKTTYEEDEGKVEYEEARTVGLGAYAILDITENRIRDWFKVKTRTKYLGEIEYSGYEGK